MATDQDSFDDNPLAATATLDTESLELDDRGDDSETDGASAEFGPAAGPRCEKCAAPIRSDVVTICRSCGWYASLGTFVELDPNWETEQNSDFTVNAAPRPSHAQVWLNLLPGWAWMIVVSLVAIVAESVAVRLATPADSPLRITWSLTQLFAGLGMFAGCHVLNFLSRAAEDAEGGVCDLVVKPLKLWVRTLQHLPKRLWLVNAAACSLLAAVMSVAVIGGLPYHVLWNWGFKEPPKQNLMGAVMDRVKKVEGKGADNLEDAVGDFAGTQNVDAPKETPKPTPAKPRDKTDCVILGYQTDKDGYLTSLVLGAAYQGKLAYAGRVAPQMSNEDRAELLRSLAGIRVAQPLISIEGSAHWVRPQYACRVSFTARQEGGRLRDIEWDKLLGTIRGQ